MMDMSQYKIGTVVKLISRDEVWSEFDRCYKKVKNGFLGHVTGFSMVAYDRAFEVILTVKWCDGKEFPIHPSSVEIV